MEKLLDKAGACDRSTCNIVYVRAVLNAFIKMRHQLDGLSTENRVNICNDVQEALDEMMKSSIKFKNLHHKSKDDIDFEQFSSKILEISNNIRID